MFFPSNSFDGNSFWVARELLWRDFMTLDDALDWGAIVLTPEKDKQKLILFKNKGERGLTLDELMS